MNNLKTTPLAVAALVLSAAIPARAVDVDDRPETANFAVDKLHSQISFKVRHLGISNVTGSFGDFDAELSLDPLNLSTLETSATVRVASIDTGVERRDAHLRSEDFFAAGRFPEIRFVSKEVRATSDGFELIGDLTIRDVTQEVVLKGEMMGPVRGSNGEERIAFEATGSISRADYELKWNKLTEAGGVIVSDKVDITLDIQAVREAEGS